jgi:exo-beta-1,3-glucanase (GH17 family)
LIELANEYPDIIFSLSVGNESCVEWTDHYVHENSVLDYVRQVKAGAKQPVTFCENYVPWLFKLQKLAKEVDFISIHTYPVWEYKHIEEALDYTKENYYSVAQKYPDKPVVITEAGWATNSNGRGIDPENVNETYQKIYYEKLMAWADRENILTFFFEAFDEPWKGSPEPLEPEKHWGLFKIDRTPKLTMRGYKEQFTRLVE